MKPYIEGRGNLFDHAVTSRNADAGIAFAVMPRFYLNVIGTRHSKDDEGVVFASPGEALAHATEVARELGEDRPRGNGNRGCGRAWREVGRASVR